MKTVTSTSDIQTYALAQRQLGRNIGFVPTMGALHEGHMSLVRAARAENDTVIVSIFVNPTQFNNQEDFLKYPQTLEDDLKLLAKENVDAVFTPEAKTMYPDERRYSVTESGHEEELCGKTRPGHFNGVLTVVLKLLQLTQPHRVYMGEKDYQQLRLVKNMVDAFFIPTTIVAFTYAMQAGWR